MLKRNRFRLLPDGEPFPGLACPLRADPAAPGSHTAAREVWTLFHPPALRLRPGDRVERLPDGLRLRITGVSEPAPDGAALDLCRVTAERLVIPC